MWISTVFIGCSVSHTILPLDLATGISSVTKVYRDLHHWLQKTSLHGKSGWSLGVAEGPAAQGYPAEWWEEQIVWCGAWDATLCTKW